jgi:hypothetical protein
MMAYFFVKIARMYFYGFIFIYFITKKKVSWILGVI